MTEATLNQTNFRQPFQPGHDINEHVEKFSQFLKESSISFINKGLRRTNKTVFGDSIGGDWEALDASRTLLDLSGSLESAEIDEAKQSAIQELEEYLLLPIGWDGYAGQPLDEVLVRVAQYIVIYAASIISNDGFELKEITPCPISDGSVDIEIGLKNKHIMLTLLSEDKFSLYIEDQDGVETEKVYELTVSNLRDRLAEALS